MTDHFITDPEQSTAKIGEIAGTVSNGGPADLRSEGIERSLSMRCKEVRQVWPSRRPGTTYLDADTVVVFETQFDEKVEVHLRNGEAKEFKPGVMYRVKVEIEPEVVTLNVGNGR